MIARRKTIPKKRATQRTRRCAACPARVTTPVCPSCGTRRATSRTSISKRCDKLWSDYIKVPGKCFRCPATEGLQAAHIIGRAQRVTRWTLTNGICLCHQCHRLFDTYRIDRQALIVEAIGAAAYVRVIERAQGVWDKHFPLAELTEALAKAKGE